MVDRLLAGANTRRGGGACLEAAVDHSPGFSPGFRGRASALKIGARRVSLQRLARHLDCLPRSLSQSARFPRATTSSAATFRAISTRTNPGLKPWAMVCNRFALKPDKRGAVIFSAGQPTTGLIEGSTEGENACELQTKTGFRPNCERSREIHLETEQNIDLFLERRYSGYGEPSPKLYPQTV